MKANFPICCNKEMKIKVETSTYFEVECRKCGDVVYVKKEKTPKPTMLDD